MFFFGVWKGLFLRCKNTRFSARFVKAAGLPENKKGFRYAPFMSYAGCFYCQTPGLVPLR